MNPRRAFFPAPPMWARWALAALVAAAAIAAIVIGTQRAGPEGSSSEAGAEAEINRIADVAISQDEAPHFATLSAGSSPATALQQAIAGDLRKRIADHQITGPLQSVRCRESTAARSGRTPFRCAVRSAGIAYQFLGVVDEAARRIAWCKVDPPAPGGAGPEIPISASCRA
jgi:hypothetical protein